MKIDIRFFASVREALGTAQLNVDTGCATVGELRRELAARGSDWADALAPGRAVRVSLNQRMVDESAALADGAEVAFFPPVTGG